MTTLRGLFPAGEWRLGPALRHARLKPVFAPTEPYLLGRPDHSMDPGYLG